MADSTIVILTSLIWRGFRVERPGTLKLMLEKIKAIGAKTRRGRSERGRIFIID